MVFVKVQTPRTQKLIFESNISLLVVVVEILDVEVVTVVDFCTNVDVVSVVDFCLNVVVAKSPVKIQCFLIVEYETSEDFE